MTNGGRVPYIQKKSNKKEPLKIVDHSDLTPEEKQAAYKFFRDHPEEVLGEKEERKRKLKKSSVKKCRCKK